jgi:DNA mismatch repair protein MutL
MGKIAVLDENMVNMIAAGEVVERPASVVKELLENSIDAGAKKIIVAIEDGGKKFISISDDGCGMDAGDLTKAFVPHATSKIKTSDDLGHIATMGFRGEALASIASVAQVKAVSRQADSLEAACIEFDCGTKTAVVPCSGGYGTTIEVRTLFYKLPARQKFLRTANTEMSHITEQFTRIALAHCELDLTLIHNGKELYRLLGGQSIRQRIAALLSEQIANAMIEFSSNERGLEVVALLGRPDAARATSDYQYVFLNGRFIKDKFISHAIKEAYRGLIEPGKYPVVFLFLTMPYTAYDVNVHPTKIEVRFDNANLVHSQVLGVLREKLLGTPLDALAQMPKTASPDFINEPISLDAKDRRKQIAEAMAEFFKENKPTHSQQQFSYSRSATTENRSQKTEDGERRTEDRGQILPLPSTSGGCHPSSLQSPKKFIQLHDSYIVAQIDEGFVIIDQHALHERILYEDLCRKIAEGNLESQRLLIPESFEVTDAQIQAMEQNNDLIAKLGIALEPFGPKTIAIQAFPSLLAKVSPVEFVQDLLDLLTDKRLSPDAERLLHEVLDMTACKAAIKAGQKLADAEIERLIADKEAIERASRCPHGRPTTITFSLDDLQKQFKRT